MGGHRILIVEDHDDARRALEAIFTRTGWSVRSARTVAEALLELQSEPQPCCVLLDLMLPDGRGETVLQEVRAKGLRSRVVINTGSVLALDEFESLVNLRPDAILAKPITAESVWAGPCRVCEAASDST